MIRQCIDPTASRRRPRTAGGTRGSASDASAKRALPFNTDYVDVSLIAKTQRSIYCYSADSFPIIAPNLTDLFPIVRPFMRAALITGEYSFFFF